MATGDIHSKVKDLPPAIQSALAAVGYGRADIALEGRERLSLQNFAMGDGYRAFTVVVDMVNGGHRVERGSWGGPNPWSREAVDNDDREYAIRPGLAIIKGDQGGGKPVYARLYLHPDNLVKLLPAGPEVTDRDVEILKIFSMYKGGEYRKHELSRHNTTDAEVTSLVERGLLDRNRAGATKITTDGRNAVASKG